MLVFRCHCSSSLIHPIGWSEKVGHRILVASKDYKNVPGFKNSKPDMFVPVSCLCCEYTCLTARNSIKMNAMRCFSYFFSGHSLVVLIFFAKADYKSFFDDPFSCEVLLLPRCVDGTPPFAVQSAKLALRG